MVVILRLLTLPCWHKIAQICEDGPATTMLFAFLLSIMQDGEFLKKGNPRTLHPTFSHIGVCQKKKLSYMPGRGQNGAPH